MSRIMRPATPRRVSRSWTQTQRRSGFTIIEALVAVLITSMSVAALVSLWNFAFRITTRADNQGVAYSIGRHSLEQIKQSGFDFAPEGASTVYCDAQGNEHQARQAGDAFQITTNVASQGPYPSYDATRTVTLTVVLLTTGEQLYQSGTLLVKAGI